MSDTPVEAREQVQASVLKAKGVLTVLNHQQQTVYFNRLDEREKVTESLGTFFDNLEDNPCASCLDTCCTSGNGHFHALGETLQHPDILRGEVKLEDYFVDHQPEDFPVGSVLRGGKCAFLKSGLGCNLPQKYRSNVCLRYSCGRMDRVLVHHGKKEELEGLNRLLRCISEKIGFFVAAARYLREIEQARDNYAKHIRKAMEKE